MRNLLDDLRYSVRKLVHSPGFSAFAIAIVAVGTGASTAVFSLVNAVLLRPLPGVQVPSRLMTLYRVQKGDSFDNFSYPDYLDFRHRAGSFNGMAAHSGVTANLRSDRTERARADLVTENYFAVLGATAAVGALSLPADGSAAAVLNYDFWQRRFGGDSAAIGATVVINGFPFTVVGIAANGFHGTVAGERFDLWLPLAMHRRLIPHLSADILANRAAGWIELFGRLRPGTSAARADAELKTIARQLAAEHPVTNGSRSVAAVAGLGWYPEDRAQAAGLLRLIGAAVALLSLIACANLAGLFLVRSSGRRREIALRLAVGAGRGRVVRLLLAEGLLLAAAGGAAGLLLSQWTARWMSSFRPQSMLRRFEVTIDGRVVAFAIAASATAGLLFALVPALRAAPLDIVAALKQGDRGSGVRRTRGRALLMVAQVALSFVLLTSAAMLARRLQQLLAADPGYLTSQVAMAAIDLTVEHYSAERGLAFYSSLFDRLQRLPGGQSATLAGTVPPEEWPGRLSVFRPGDEPPPDVLQGREMELGLRVDINRVASRYFETLGIRLEAGRDFSLLDTTGTPLVAIVNRALAERMWPRENPIGKRLACPLWNGTRRPALEVVGLAADTRSRALDAAPVPLLYVPLFQNYDGRARLLVRTRGRSAAALGAIERSVAELNPDLPVFAADTMENHVALSLWQQRVSLGAIGVFSLLALVLTAVGLYGVIAQSVAQRTREVGIRMALGAQPGAVSRMMLKEGMLLAAAGILAGIPIAPAAARLLGVHPDAIAYVAVPMLLAAVLLAACWLPARGATRVDPAVTLRD